MKKSLSLILLLLILPLVSAISINIKDSYQPGETLLGTLEGNFLSPLTAENFYFYSDRIQVPLIFDIARVQDKYYFYALLPVEEANYTLVLKDISYFENGKEHKNDFQKNFSISGNVIDFSVSPGFLIIKNSSSITVESENQLLNVVAKLLNTTQSATVSAGQKKKIYFSSAGITNFTLANIELSALNTKYSIPAAILSSSASGTENISESEKFRFSRDEYNFSVYEKNDTIFSIYLQNLGDKAIKNITLNFSSDLEDVITFSSYHINELAEKESQKIDISVNAPIVKRYIGKLSAYSGNYSTSSLLIINAQESGTTLPAPSPVSPPGNSCVLDLNGITCPSGTSCTGTLENSDDGECCIGTCQQQASYTSYIIGIILLVIVAVGVFFLYKKSRKGRINSEDIMKKSEKKFNEKTNPGIEIRNGLTKS